MFSKSGMNRAICERKMKTESPANHVMSTLISRITKIQMSEYMITQSCIYTDTVVDGRGHGISTVASARVTLHTIYTECIQPQCFCYHHPLSIISTQFLSFFLTLTVSTTSRLKVKLRHTD